MNSFLWWGLIILWAQTTVTALLAFMATGFLPRLFASLSAQFGVILLSLWALKRFDLKKLHYDLLSVASLILVSLAVSGFGDAQNDKHLRFTDLPSPWIGCRDLQIRRRFSDFSLAIARDNSRVLVNDNCEVKYTVTSAKRFTPLPEGAPADQIMTLF
jgi:hypothetical protein